MSSTIKISLPGSDVSGHSPKDFALLGIYPNPKIDTTARPPHAGIVYVNWATAGIVIPVGTTKILHSFPHGYDYVPTVIAACEFDNGTNRSGGTLPFQVGSIALITVDADNTNINLKHFSLDIGAQGVPPYTLRVRFYVMAERGLE